VSDVSARVARDFSGASVRVTDLGRVPAREAAGYLLALAEGSAGGEAGEDAIFPVTLADSVDISRQLLRIARSEAVPQETRRSAVFWLGQQAGDEVTRGLVGLVDDDGQSRELREGAVFSLSQRPRDESVPALIRIARTHRDGQIRRAALFWLGQSRDPRARALIEETLEN
jgi:HEAT repeat protein